MSLDIEGWVLFDADGTLCDHQHRLHHVTGPRKDWDAYKSKDHLDGPMVGLVETYRALAAAGLWMVIITGREEDRRDRLVEWLERHDLRWDRILMRPTGDYREDIVVKAELLERVMAEDGLGLPLIAFEDRARVAAMWRQKGIRCCLVEEGNF